MPKTKAAFIEPMLLLRTEKLPQGADWSYEIKLDGYRALAIKTGGKVQLRSRNDNDFTERYSSIAAALRSMPDETVLDGEMAALDEEGRPSFNLLQNYGSAECAAGLLRLRPAHAEGSKRDDEAAERSGGRYWRARSCQSSLSRSATPRS